MTHSIQKCIGVLLLLSILLPSAVFPFATHAQNITIDTSISGLRSTEVLIQRACSGWNPLSYIDLNCIILNTIWLVDSFLIHTVLKLSTKVFDLSVSLNLKDITKEFDFVKIGWGIVRDITNLFFIFILLWIALATIFNIQGYGAKDLLAQLIIAALLVNFSLAIAGFFINFTNALGKAFYDATTSRGSVGDRLLAFTYFQIPATQPVDTTELSTSDQKIICKQAAAKVSCKDAIPGDEIAFCDSDYFYQSCLKDAQFAVKIKEGQELSAKLTDAIYQVLWLLIIIPILSFVFFAGAIFLLVRALMLAFLSVFAPIVFLFWILPTTRSHWNDWWNRLIQWSFFAPAFLFLLFLTITTFEQFSSRIVGKITPTGFLAISFQMILFVALMIMNLMVAQKMGIMFAGSVIGVGSKVAGWTGRQVRGAAYRGTVRGATAMPVAQEFLKSGVGKRMAQIPFIRGLTQPAVAIQAERDRIDKERADRLQRAVGTMPPEFAAQRLLGESRNVQEAFYKSARPDDVEKIMKGLIKEMKTVDQFGNQVTMKDERGEPVLDRSAAEKEIIKVRNRDPRLAERIESSVKDLHLKVVASKGVALGTPVAEAQRTAQDQQHYRAFQSATNAYLNEQNNQKLKQVLSKENMNLEQVSEYMLQNFGEREAKAVSKTTEQVRAFADTLMKAVEKEKKVEFTQRVVALKSQGVSEARSRFLAFQELAPRVIKNPSLQRWIASAPGVRALYRGVPIRESGRRGGDVAPPGVGTPPV